MSESQAESLTGEASADQQAASADPADLRAQIELLEAENERLREQYSDARRSNYREAALGMAAVGLLAIVSAFLFPLSQTVLLALGATGLFSAVLTYYFTPERFIAATVGERVSASLARNEADLVSTLGLQDERVYVPADTDALSGPARLFVPHERDYEIPDPAALSSLLVVTEADEEWGVSLRPSGARLYTDVADTMGEDLAETPTSVVPQLADAAVEQFGIVARAVTEETGDSQLSVGILGDVYGGADTFDSPLVSLLGTGLAATTSEPVVVDTHHGDDRYDYVVTLSWGEREKETSNSGSE